MPGSALVAEEVVLGDRRVRYRVAGAGPPLVLLHGNGDSAFSWSWVGPVLARHYQVYALDLPGFGDGAALLPDYRPAALAGWVSAFLDRLAIERAALIGNSLGGAIALSLALAQPRRITALGLVASAGLGQWVNPLAISLALPGGAELAGLWGGNLPRHWLRMVLPFAHPGRVPAAWFAEQERLARRPGFVAATTAALRAVVDWSGQRELLLGKLPRLAMPTLVLWGAEDRIFPVWQAQLAAQCLRRGRLVILPDCGHLPHVERPVECAAALYDFLAAAGVEHAVPKHRAILGQASSV